MAKCYNRNDAGYTALRNVYSSDVETSQVVSNWQKLNDSDVFPSVVQAQAMVKDQNILFSLKQKEFGESVLENIRRERIGSRLAGQFLLNNSNPATQSFDEAFLQGNLKRFNRYLDINNIPRESFKVTRTPQSYKIEAVDSLFKARDILPKSRSWDTNRSRAVVMHLKKMFPQVNIKMLSVAQARIMYQELPKWKKSNVGFDSVNSFYVDGTAYLIKGRVTDEIAIEEMLHPFIDAIKMENEELFNGLLDESVKTFPELAQQIEDAYNSTTRNFSDTERDLEIVTQALSRHFNKEYETTPKRPFLLKVKELLEWFKSVIDNLNKYITGRALPVSAIKEGTSLSDIAKLLNTEGIEFKLDKRVDGKIRYSLTPAKEAQVKAALLKANDVQKPIIMQLFNVAQLEDGSIVDSLSASVKDAAAGDSIVTLNKENHTYINSQDKEKVYTSVTTAIKGKLSPAKQVEHQINLDIGNEVDTLLDGVIAGYDFEKSFAAVETSNISKEQMKKTFDTLGSIMDSIRMKGAIVMSQVVLFDEVSKMAGTADVFIIDQHGRVNIMDLKTTKNELSKMVGLNDAKGKRLVNQYKGREYLLESDSLLIDQYDKDGKLIKEGVTKVGSLEKLKALSTETQHNLQVNIYRRMAENMGYEVSYDEWATSTIHFKVDIDGVGIDQVFNGNIEFDRWIPHPMGQNLTYVNAIVPEVLNDYQKSRLEQQQEGAYNKIFNGKDQKEETTENDKKAAENFDEYNIAAGLLDSYQKALIAKRDMIPLLKSNIYMQSTKQNEIDQISKTIAYINIAMGDNVKGQSTALSEVLQDALQQIKDFSNFIEDPKNVNSKEYVSYVLNFDKFMKTFEGLYLMNDPKILPKLNKTQQTLISSLQTQLNRLSGAGTDTGGVVGQALKDYVMEQVRLRSTNNYGGEGSFFTEEDLILLMDKAVDIGDIEYQTKDLATSPDVLLSVMDKIRKAQNQKLLDKIQERERLIRAAGQKLAKLSPESSLEDLYDFMLEFDSDGIFNGQYVTQVGQQYWTIQDRLRSVLYDNEGTPYQYRPIFNVEEAAKTEQGKKDIEYNIDLANKKRAFGDFFMAEKKKADGSLGKGDYHEYSQEFIDARNKFEEWKPGPESSDRGFWEMKNGTSPANYAAFQARYYEGIEYTKAVRINGQATGAIIIERQGFMVPKVEFRKVRLDSPVGGNMRSAKYQSILEGTDAKSVAEREFYQLYIDMYENDLLKKIPIGQASNMLGRVPLVQNKIMDEVASKGTVFTKAYAKMIRTNAWNMFQQTSTQKNVILDNQGYIIDQLPVYYTGRPKLDTDMADLQKRIDYLKQEYKTNNITDNEYKKDIAVLNGKMNRLKATPSTGQISKDMASSLLKFSAMAENYETMGAIDDTLKAFVKVIEKRTYTPAEGLNLSLVGRTKDKIFENLGTKANTSTQEKNTVRRAKKFMSMIHYDNEQMTKGAVDKIANGLIQLSSLSYVAFNPFGNFNNYLIGRINNNIESIGGRFFTQKSFKRATWEFNKRALPSLVQRTAHGGAEDLLDVVTLGIIPGLAKADYNKKLPNSKYEAFVDMFRMMDSMTDIREQSSATNDGKSWFDRATEWGYIMQDAAEYNSQTKVGMAILMDTKVKQSNGGGELSFYDAFEFDTVTNTNKIKEGYDTIIKRNGQEVPYTDDFRYEIRNEIREVNKQIHGNYAKEDRMVLQTHTLGNLAVQFKKWLAPAIRARYQREYFDQNLGWMEGRYRSALSFINYARKEIFQGNMDLKNMGKDYLDAQVNFYSKDKFGVERKFGEGGNMDQRAKNKLFGFYRSMGELGIMFSVMFMSMLFDDILGGDDDDSDTTKRFKNLTRYQADRVYKELVLFMPSFAGFKQVEQMFSSPVAASRSVSELSEFAEMLFIGTFKYSVARATGNLEGKDGFYGNSNYVYQRGQRKGELKLYKNFKDVFPLVYSIQKWESYLKNSDFYIK
jgi:hypothetical protein